MLEQRAFRNILGHFATGVALITAQTPKGPVGLAVNSFTSVSLNPPLVALCAAHTSTTWPAIRASGGFAVTILGERQAELCHTFSVRAADRFSGQDWALSHSGHPLADDGLAWLDCRISQVHAAGDHDLVIAEVTAGALRGQTGPLVFHAGRFTRLMPTALQLSPRRFSGRSKGRRDISRSPAAMLVWPAARSCGE